MGGGGGGSGGGRAKAGIGVRAREAVADLKRDLNGLFPGAKRGGRRGRGGGHLYLGRPEAVTDTCPTGCALSKGLCIVTF